MDPKAQISLLALAGVRTSETMQIALHLGNSVFVALVDSGSTHKFVSTKAARRSGLHFLGRDNLRVAMANGERVT